MGVFTKMKAANKAAAKVTNRDRNADYKVTQQGIDAIMANLKTSQKGLGSTLSAKSQRTLDAMSRVSNVNQASLNKLLKSSAGNMTHQYGSAIGNDPNLLRGSRAVASGQAAVNKGILAGGKTNVRAGNEALDIIKAAGVTAGKSSQYELAQALSARASDDAEAIAARTTELAKIRLDDRLQMKRMEADAALNERYLHLQARLANGGGGGEGFQSAASTLLGMQQDGATAEQARNAMGALAIQYNLGPAAKAKLQDMVGQLYGGGGQEADGNSTPYGEAFREQAGISPSAYLADEMEQGLNKDVWAAFNPNKPVPSTAEAMAIAGVTYDPESGKPLVGGQEVAPELAAAAIAYVQSTWYRIAQSVQGSGTVSTGGVRDMGPQGGAAGGTR